MMNKLTTTIANQALGIVLRTAFSPNSSVSSMRKAFDFLTGASAEALRKKYPQVKIEPGKIAGISVETVHTPQSTGKTILYLHGGGYFMGGLHSYRRNALRLAYRCKARVIVAEYRLTPENPYPTALDDAIAVYRELIQTISPCDLIIAGDSAGGGLTLATLLRLRDEKAPLPAGAFVLSPFLDLNASFPSYDTRKTREVWLDRRHIAKWAPWYAGKTAPNHPYVSPVFGDYVGFPPVLVMTGEEEVLHDEAAEVVRKMEEAGVRVRFDVGPRMQHVWMFSLPFLQESKKAMKTIATFVESC